MKFTKYLLIPFAMACINVAQAESVTSAKQLNLPFSNEPLFSRDHTGLFFNYDMSGTPTKKIVCNLSKVYKGWLEFRNEGSIEESKVYGDGDSATLILTNKGRRMDDQYHANISGGVKVNALKGERGAHAAASCHYEADDNV